MGYDKVYDMLQQCFYWYHMSEDVKVWLAACENCQWAKARPGRGSPPLEQDTEGRHMGHLGMDIACLFREGESGCKYIQVMQDYFLCMNIVLQWWRTCQ